MTNLTHMVTVSAVEHLDEQMLQSKFADLQAILFRTQAAYNERSIALAALETVESQLNRAQAKHRFPAPRP